MNPAEAISLAHKEMDEMSCRPEDRFTLVGTTTCVCYLFCAAEGEPTTDASSRRRRFVVCGNAGDSRAVLCKRDGKAKRLSFDHKGTVESEQERIRQLNGFVLHGRVNAVLSVTRAIGDCALKQWVTSEPFVSQTAISEDEDKVLIIACDGMWDVIDDEMASDMAMKMLFNRRSASEMAAEFVQESLRRGTTDNVSVVVAIL